MDQCNTHFRQLTDRYDINPILLMSSFARSLVFCVLSDSDQLGGNRPTDAGVSADHVKLTIGTMTSNRHERRSLCASWLGDWITRDSSSKAWKWTRHVFPETVPHHHHLTFSTGMCQRFNQVKLADDSESRILLSGSHRRVLLPLFLFGCS
jgi:hypothetical protein